MSLPEAWEVAARRFELKPDYPNDPVAWIRDMLKEFSWSKQQEILESIKNNRYTAVMSCHASGKSFIASRAMTWWGCTHNIGDAFIVSTAPSAAQVSSVMWREVRRAMKNGDFDNKGWGSVVESGYPQWKVNGELIGYGRKPADYSDSVFQGIHSEFVLVVIDEADGVSANMFESVDTLTTNSDARVLAIGNPVNPTSHFASICKPGSGWNVIQIDGLRTPNFTKEAVEGVECNICKPGSTPLLQTLFEEENIPYATEEIPEKIKSLLISPMWVEERLHRWVGAVDPDIEDSTLSSKAAESSLFTSRVRGRFPTDAADGVIPLGWIQLAVARWYDMRDATDKNRVPAGIRILGVDVAYEGEDETCVAVRQGIHLYEVKHLGTPSTMATANKVSGMLAPHPGGTAVVDVIGYGAGVYDRLIELGHNTVAFTASKSAKYPGSRGKPGKPMTDRTGEFKFANQRAAAWWRLRELLDPSYGPQITLPDDEMLIADLSTPKWSVSSNNVILIESKDEIRKRLGRSTDSGDAVIQAWWVDAVPVGGAAKSKELPVVQWVSNQEYLESDDLLDAWADRG